MTENSKSPKFYKEVEISDYWTLTDLLYWAAARVLPTPMYFDEDEGRESIDALNEYPLSLGTELGAEYLGPDETNRLGLGADPDWEYIQRMISGKDDTFTSEHHKRMADLVYEGECPEAERLLREQNRKEQLRLYEKALKIEEHQKKWKLELADALDETICSLIVKLKTGEINAEGIKIEIDPNGDFEEEIDEWLNAQSWSNGQFYSAHSPIPQGKWISRNVDWGGTYIRNGAEVYLAVRFDCDDIIALFPPISKELVQIDSSGEYLFGFVGATASSNTAKRIGRPTKNSDAIHRKIASIIAHEGGLIAKQDAFAHEIKDWYQLEFGETIGLSTIKAKLSGYYKDPTFKKSKK